MKQVIINIALSLALIFTFNDSSAAPLKFNGKALKKYKFKLAIQIKQDFQKKILTAPKINDLTINDKPIDQRSIGFSIEELDNCSDMGLDSGYRIEKIYTTSVLVASATAALVLICSKI